MALMACWSWVGIVPSWLRCCILIYIAPLCHNCPGDEAILFFNLTPQQPEASHQTKTDGDQPKDEACPRPTRLEAGLRQVGDRFQVTRIGGLLLASIEEAKSSQVVDESAGSLIGFKVSVELLPSIVLQRLDEEPGWVIAHHGCFGGGVVEADLKRWIELSESQTCPVCEGDVYLVSQRGGWAFCR